MSTEKTEQRIRELMGKNSLSLATPPVAKPDYVTRFSGVLLTFVSTIGLILTSPLLFLGGITGLFTSIFSGADPFESGLNGAKIGSLGSISGVSLGIELAQATLAVEDIDLHKAPLLEMDSKELESAPPESSVEQETITEAPIRLEEQGSNAPEVTVQQESVSESPITLEEPTSKTPEITIEQETVTETPITAEEQKSERRDTTFVQETVVEPPKEEAVLDKPKVEPIVQPQDHADTAPVIKASSLPSAFFPKAKIPPSTQTPLEVSKIVAPRSIEVPEQFKDFMTKVNALIIKEETQVRPQEESQPTITEQSVADLIQLIKDHTLSAAQFWIELDKMSNADIKLFVSKFNYTKEKGKRSRSELDHLWNYFKGVEIETSKEEQKKEQFAVVLTALSDMQLRASLDSPSFLSILTNQAYIATAANTLNREQLALFASNNANHEMLNDMIKKLKPSPSLLGKLVSILPYGSNQVRTRLIEQINALANCPTTFRVELRELAQYYIFSNEEAERKRLAAIQPPPLTKTQSLPAKRWAPVQASTKPVYNTAPIQKPDWTGEEFNKFVQDLNDTEYYFFEQELHKKLACMPDDRVKMLIKRATSLNCKELLTHLWIIESKTLNARADVNSRENRLKIVLENLSESQLQSSVAENKFWEIFRNTQEPFCKMAADTLTPQQFATIIANAPLERHEDFAVIIGQIGKDSPAEKIRLQEIIKAIIPYTTPWFALVLERQIKNVTPQDKSLAKRFTAEFKEKLHESLQKTDVLAKYKLDTTLDRVSMSALLKTSTSLSTSEEEDLEQSSGSERLSSLRF